MIINYFNAFLCLLIAIRLFTFNSRQHKYKPLLSWQAWVMICACAAITLFSCFGFSERALIAQIIMNGCILVGILSNRGNVADMYKQLTSAHRYKIPLGRKL